MFCGCCVTASHDSLASAHYPLPYPVLLTLTCVFFVGNCSRFKLFDPDGFIIYLGVVPFHEMEHHLVLK